MFHERPSAVSTPRRIDMVANIGTADRAVRVVIGIVLIALVFVGPQTPWGWIGLIPLGTALIRWCPLYRVFGIRTCSAGGGKA
jgi:hypothetical protein